ncbi:two-component system, response regulator, stage 0 sporulation protein F [Gracilibacillus ureilyticus]|uniref:Two-component system, response regulator, stage 0 sporulation protein F n=1 Tax=Gracilibacillus ureilyticus TaxID=531814 RepID=A0A1H9W357_9BACI|nr:response regulator [Gracilibacillus ureilyticus]SES28234.1 two-component system, response regulator, stage 0 sporulation protein F [Gracilibacillus ureilyticus]
MSKTVLVVDDQIGIRLLLQEVITHEGYQVELAMNGQEALDKINSREPDLIMLDYKLPIIDGHALVKQLVEKGIETPVIVMSGLPDRAEEKMNHYPVVKSVIGKPFQLNDIRIMVKDIIDGKCNQPNR